MKIIAGVPTHKRTRAPLVAKQLGEIADHVFIVAKDCDIEIPPLPYISLIEQKEGQLREARNTIIELAEEAGADWVLQADDDLAFPTDVLKAMRKLTDYDYLGAICSQPSRFFYFAREATSSHPFLFAPTITQLYLLRLDTIREVGNFRFETMEDIDWGMKAWDSGWGVAKIHLTKELTHTPVIPRTTKTESQGGQSVACRDAAFPEAVEYLNARYGGGVLKWIKICEPGSKRTFSVRYGWETMLKRLGERWGPIGYEDSYGRKV